MGSEKGKLIKCDRCGKEHFLKFIGVGEADGGYTTWDKFEDLPDTWMYDSRIGYLCDSCAGIFRLFIHHFMRGKVAPSWKIRDGDPTSLTFNNDGERLNIE